MLGWKVPMHLASPCPTRPLRKCLAPGILCWLASLTSCITGPAYTLPDPLPETLEWTKANQTAGRFLGLEVRENDGDSLESLFFDPGVRVVQIVQNSPAAKVGVQLGDVLLRFNDQDINDPQALATVLSHKNLGDVAVLDMQRGDSVFRVELTLGPAPLAPSEAELLWLAEPARTRAGWLSSQGGALLVTMDPEGPAASAGLEVGCVVTALDGNRVLSARALLRRVQAMNPGQSTQCTYRDTQGQMQSTELVLLKAPNRLLSFSIPFLVDYQASADGESVSLEVLDFWLIWLLNYDRKGIETRWNVLRVLNYSHAVGELSQ